MFRGQVLWRGRAPAPAPENLSAFHKLTVSHGQSPRTLPVDFGCCIWFDNSAAKTCLQVRIYKILQFLRWKSLKELLLYPRLHMQRQVVGLYGCSFDGLFRPYLKPTLDQSDHQKNPDPQGNEHPRVSAAKQQHQDSNHHKEATQPIDRHQQAAAHHLSRPPHHAGYSAPHTRRAVRS